MPPKKAPQNDKTATEIIALDIGYGVTKALRYGQQPILFPSIAGHFRAGKFRDDELSASYPGDLITHEGKNWVVGYRAQKFLAEPQQIMLRGRTANEETLGNVFRTRLALAAIGKMFPGLRNDGNVIHLKVATGLPVSHMGDAADLKAALKGQHRIQTDATDFVVNITDVYVMPQPYGTIYSNTLTSTGDINECHTARRTGVVDIGTYTVDIALDDANEFVDEESISVEAGVSIAHKYIANEMETRYRQKFSPRDVEMVLKTGCFTLPGDEGQDDFSAEVEEALAPVLDATLAKMGELWKTGMNVGVIYLTGGVASRLHKSIKTVYRQTVVSKNPQVDNVQGYLNYAVSKQIED